MTTTLPILPPAMLGILGGGQLGCMFTVAAKTLGYRVTVLDPDPHAPAARFADVHLCAPFDDETALTQLAGCAAVTTEFENVNADAMRALAQHTRISPGGDCVAIAQNRILEKNRIRAAGLATAPFKAIRTEDDIGTDCEALLPGILKTATLGYDGKGQVRVSTLKALQAAFAELDSVPCVLEKQIDLHTEISVIVCRLDAEHCTTFPVAENLHENGILAWSIVPARVDAGVQERARRMAVQLADALDYVGVLAVELFVCAGGELLVNEIAPRPHNSGHYTLNACAADQFQQQVRILCGLPPAATRLLSPCTMANILGDVWGKDHEPHWQTLLRHPETHLHLYGKTQARPGRKMGHFTVLADSADTAYTTATALHRSLKSR